MWFVPRNNVGGKMWRWIDNLIVLTLRCLDVFSPLPLFIRPRLLPSHTPQGLRPISVRWHLTASDTRNFTENEILWKAERNVFRSRWELSSAWCFGGPATKPEYRDWSFVPRNTYWIFYDFDREILFAMGCREKCKARLILKQEFIAEIQRHGFTIPEDVWRKFLSDTAPTSLPPLDVEPVGPFR